MTHTANSSCRGEFTPHSKRRFPEEFENRRSCELQFFLSSWFLALRIFSQVLSIAFRKFRVHTLLHKTKNSKETGRIRVLRIPEIISIACFRFSTVAIIRIHSTFDAKWHRVTSAIRNVLTTSKANCSNMKWIVIHHRN